VVMSFIGFVLPHYGIGYHILPHYGIGYHTLRPVCAIDRSIVWESRESRSVEERAETRVRVVRCVVGRREAWNDAERRGGRKESRATRT